MRTPCAIGLLTVLLAATACGCAGSQLCDAIARGDEDTALELIRERRDLAATDANGHGALHVAAIHGRAPLIDPLVAAGLSVETLDSEGWTPLLLAAQQGHVDVARRFLAHKANVDARNPRGGTPLYVASFHGRADMVRVLLEGGADVDSSAEDGWTPLLAACESGALPVVQLLLDRGANILERNDFGASPLFVASHHGHLGIVEHLLSKGAFVDAQDVNRWTPLNTAAANGPGHDRVTVALLRAGAKLHLPRRFPETVAHTRRAYARYQASLRELDDAAKAYRSAAESFTQVSDNCLALAARARALETTALLLGGFSSGMSTTFMSTGQMSNAASWSFNEFQAGVAARTQGASAESLTALAGHYAEQARRCLRCVVECETAGDTDNLVRRLDAIWNPTSAIEPSSSAAGTTQPR